MKVYVDNKEIEFKAKEFSLLYYLIHPLIASLHKCIAKMTL